MILKMACGILLFLVSGYSAGENLNDSDKLDRVRSDIDAVKKKMQQLSVQRTSLNEQLADIEKRYGFAASELRDLQLQVVKKNGRLAEIRESIRTNRDQIAQLGNELSGHIRAAYIMGREEKLKLILNQQDTALSGRMMVYHSYLNKVRLQQLAEFEDALSQLNQLNRDQLAEAEQLEQDLIRKKHEQNELDRLRLQRGQLIARLAGDFNSSEQRLSQLLESETKLKDLIEDLDDQGMDEADAEESGFAWTEWFSDSKNDPDESIQNNDIEQANAGLTENVDFLALKGKLPWPVKGRVNSAQGADEDTVESIRDGVLIDASEGAEIQAVTSGKVVYAEWLRGYGLLMIIDHGQGYMTLYAFNQSLYKRVGEQVRTGEVIASVGQSGGRSRSGLYFGIRKDKKAVDPLEWCQKENQG